MEKSRAIQTRGRKVSETSWELGQSPSRQPSFNRKQATSVPANSMKKKLGQRGEVDPKGHS
jgi:hypothetical protein